MITARRPTVIPQYVPMAPALVTDPFHPPGWIYEEKVPAAASYVMTSAAGSDVCADEEPGVASWPAPTAHPSSSTALGLVPWP
jgi:hypothetical protein